MFSRTGYIRIPQDKGLMQTEQLSGKYYALKVVIFFVVFFIVCYALQFRNFSLGIEAMIYCQLLIQIQIYLKNNTLRSNIIMIGIS